MFRKKLLWNHLFELVLRKAALNYFFVIFLLAILKTDYISNIFWEKFRKQDRDIFFKVSSLLRTTSRELDFSYKLQTLLFSVVTVQYLFHPEPNRSLVLVISRGTEGRNTEPNRFLVFSIWVVIIDISYYIKHQLISF